MTCKINKLYIFLLILLTYSCSTRNEKKKKDIEIKKVEITTPDFNVALRFINDYANHCDKLMKKEITDSNWVYNNNLLTESFKKRHKFVIDSAFIEDPDMGLDADPIFDAQDYPDHGFEIRNSEKSTGFVTVQGKDWKDFNVVLKVVSQNGKWLVDGAGIINIPTEKRAKR
jgi:hypothetical protein